MARVTKAMLQNIITKSLDTMATATTRYELVSFKTKRVEELGEQLVYITAKENIVHKFKYHEAKMECTMRYIYSITTGEFMDINFQTI